MTSLPDWHWMYNEQLKGWEKYPLFFPRHGNMSGQMSSFLGNIHDDVSGSYTRFVAHVNTTPVFPDMH